MNLPQTYHKLLLVSLLVIPLFLVCQKTDHVDSLKTALQETVDKQEQADLLNSIAEFYRTHKFDESLFYAQQAYDLSLKTGYAKGQVDALTKKAAIYARKSDFHRALTMARKADSIAVANDLISERISTQKLTGSIFIFLGDFERASMHVIQGLKIAEKLDDKKAISSFYSSMGMIYDYQQNFEKAYEYYAKSLAISREINDKKGIARELNNLANAGWYLGKTDSYEESMRQAIALNKELKHMTWLQMNYFNLGELFFINGQLDSAMIYNQYAYDIADELGDLKSMSGIKVAMSRQNLKRTGDLNSCIVLAHEAYGLAASTDSKKEIYEAATLLKELYEQENNLDSAYKYAIIMFRMKDSLDIDKTNANIAKLEMLHELEKETLALEKAKDDTILRIILVAGTLFFVLVLVVAFNYRSTVKSKLALLEKQKEADDQLRQSEAKFRGVFNSMVDVFTRSTMDGKCVIVSPSIHKLFGYHPEEVIGRNLADFYANPGERNEIIQRLNDSNEVEHFEFEAVKKNGDIITVSANAKIYHDEDGNPLGVEGVIRDVTEKNRAEKALQESEALFRGVFNNMIDVFTRADIKGNCLLISPSVYDILGYIPEEIIGKNYEEFFARPEDWKNLNQKLIDAGAMRDVQSELVRKDGSRAIISSNAKIFYDEEGNPAGMESVFRDITDQKRAESEHDKLFNVSFDLLCIAGFDGYFKELNPAWEKATGYTANELKSKPFLEFIHPDDRENTLEEFQLLLNGEMTYSFENRYIRKNGETMYLSWTATPVRDEELLYSIARDITERKKIEHQLANYQKRLKDLTTEIILAEERVRKQIAADLHDHVGQLLTSIRMQLVSLNKMVDNAEASTRINGISQAALTAVQATREAIFNLSLPQLNELGLVAATHDWMKEQIQEKHFIKTSLEGEDLVLNIDENTRVLLFRSLRELMMNVVKHARAKNLKINFQTKDDDLVITVEDDGVGFHYNAQMVRLQGKGFGLFSIQERLSDLGGTMKVTSAPGQGTTIELKTPLNKVLA